MCIEIWCFWPLTASKSSEVKNDHTHVITQDICNRFMEINFFVGCMVSQPNCLFQGSTTMPFLIRFHFSGSRPAKTDSLAFIMHLWSNRGCKNPPWAWGKYTLLWRATSSKNKFENSNISFIVDQLLAFWWWLKNFFFLIGHFEIFFLQKN